VGTSGPKNIALPLEFKRKKQGLRSDENVHVVCFQLSWVFGLESFVELTLSFSARAAAGANSFPVEGLMSLSPNWEMKESVSVADMVNVLIRLMKDAEIS